MSIKVPETKSVEKTLAWTLKKLHFQSSIDKSTWGRIELWWSIKWPDLHFSFFLLFLCFFLFDTVLLWLIGPSSSLVVPPLDYFIFVCDPFGQTYIDTAVVFFKYFHLKIDTQKDEHLVEWNIFWHGLQSMLHIKTGKSIDRKVISAAKTKHFRFYDASISPYIFSPN